MYNEANRLRTKSNIRNSRRNIEKRKIELECVANNMIFLCLLLLYSVVGCINRCSFFVPCILQFYFIDRWFCHFDDDNYVNIPRLVSLLNEYNPAMEWYLGKPSVASQLEINLEHSHIIEYIKVIWPVGNLC